MVDDTSPAIEDSSARPTPWFLYLIECIDGSLYTGIAVDVAARYAKHVNGKGARYTRARPPARLIGFVEYPDRSSASKAEYHFKKLKAADKRRTLAALMSQSPADNRLEGKRA